MIALLTQILLGLIAAPVIAAQPWPEPAGGESDRKPDSPADSRTTIQAAFDACNVRPEEVSDAGQRKGKSRRGERSGCWVSGRSRPSSSVVVAKALNAGRALPAISAIGGQCPPYMAFPQQVPPVSPPVVFGTVAIPPVRAPAALTSALRTVFSEGNATSIVTRPSRPCLERFAWNSLEISPNSGQTVPGTGGTPVSRYRFGTACGAGTARQSRFVAGSARPALVVDRSRIDRAAIIPISTAPVLSHAPCLCRFLRPSPTILALRESAPAIQPTGPPVA
jgi:hypothetical protein